MDQRDLLLDKLSALGTTSIVSNADGSVDVDVRRRRRPPMVDAPPATTRRPLGRAPAAGSAR